MSTALMTACELPDDVVRREAAWSDLVRRLRTELTDVLVLPEMPFVDWSVFTSREIDPRAWRRAVADHDAMIGRFAELRTGAVLSSRPVEIGGRRFNQSFSWTSAGGYHAGRSKAYLPDEPDSRESTWFERGELDPSPIDVGGLRGASSYALRCSSPSLPGVSGSSARRSSRPHAPPAVIVDGGRPPP